MLLWGSAARTPRLRLGFGGAFTIPLCACLILRYVTVLLSQDVHLWVFIRSLPGEFQWMEVESREFSR